MKKLVAFLVVVGIIIILLIATGPIFIVDEGEQAVVLRFGEIIRAETDAGLKIKTPFIDTVSKYPRRILSWDGDPRRVPTSENQFIYVDTTARWKIIDPKLFYASVTTLEGAYSRLDDIIESAVRTVIAQNALHEAVRNTNTINQVEREEDIEGQLQVTAPSDDEEEFTQLSQEGLRELADLITSIDEQETVVKGRRQLSEEMLDSAAEITPDFGIELIDIVIRQLRYSEDLTESVYDRMVSERNRIAEAYRSYGEGRKQEILGRLDREKNRVLSEAFAQAETLKGEADATAARIYSNAYSRNPAFFEFWQAIESYRETLPKFDKILTTDLEYFDFLYSERGN